MNKFLDKFADEMREMEEWIISWWRALVYVCSNEWGTDLIRDKVAEHEKAEQMLRDLEKPPG